MATEQRNLFNPKIEALSEKYTDAMGKLAATPFTGAQISAMAPKVAPQTALQQQATSLTGSGIGSYQPFVTAAQQAGTTAGTGLGLAIVNRIIIDHNGSIRVKDNHPRGTVFIIDLPYTSHSLKKEHYSSRISNLTNSS